MKRTPVLMLVMMLLVVCLVSVAFAQKKAIQFYNYDSAAAGKQLCFDTDGETLETCGGTPLPIASGGTGTTTNLMTLSKTCTSLTGSVVLIIQNGLVTSATCT